MFHGFFASKQLIFAYFTVKNALAKYPAFLQKERKHKF
jgi:hypothetical protein